MAHAPYLREKARQLRVDKKLTIDELAERLALSRSTVYYWVKDLPIEGSGTSTVFPTHGQRLGNKAMQLKYKRLRDAAYADGERTFSSLAEDSSVSQRWMKRFSSKKLVYSIQYHADQDLDELCDFWGSTLTVEPGSIRLQRKSNSNQLAGRTWRSRHGVMSVTANDTLFRARLGAWMDCLRASWA